METLTRKKNKLSWHNIFIALAFFILGYLSFQTLQYFDRAQQSQKDLSLFWDVWTLVEKKYPFEEPNQDIKIFGAISGLVASYGDDYTVFLPPKENQFLNETISGEFGGIGAEIGSRNGFLTVIAPLKDSPAEQSGLRAGDIITSVDGIEVEGMTVDDAIGNIRGLIGTNVILTVVRVASDTDPFDITITRENITVPTIDTELRDDVFIISLYNFNQSSENLFRDALVEFKNSGSQQLVLDLRNNPGGFLGSAVEMASYLLPQGEIILTEETGAGKSEDIIYRSKGYALLDDINYETIILVNGGSASAAEILAGALSDNDKGIIVGEQTYGKGSVQELIELDNNTALKVTVARWLTPAGSQISKQGITPKIIYEPLDPENQQDTQLLQALKEFNNI